MARVGRKTIDSLKNKKKDLIGPRFKPKPRPKPGDRPPPRLKPKPRPKPGDRTPQAILRRIGKGKRKPKMLPPRRPRGTAPRLPSMKDLTPEQRKKLLQLIKGMRRK